jgi:hypothetical protein
MNGSRMATKSCWKTGGAIDVRIDDNGEISMMTMRMTMMRMSVRNECAFHACSDRQEGEGGTSMAFESNASRWSGPRMKTKVCVAIRVDARFAQPVTDASPSSAMKRARAAAQDLPVAQVS